MGAIENPIDLRNYLKNQITFGNLDLSPSRFFFGKNNGIAYSLFENRTLGLKLPADLDGFSHTDFAQLTQYSYTIIKYKIDSWTLIKDTSLDLIYIGEEEALGLHSLVHLEESQKFARAGIGITSSAKNSDCDKLLEILVSKDGKKLRETENFLKSYMSGLMH